MGHKNTADGDVRGSSVEWHLIPEKGTSEKTGNKKRTITVKVPTKLLREDRASKKNRKAGAILQSGRKTKLGGKDKVGGFLEGGKRKYLHKRKQKNRITKDSVSVHLVLTPL